MQCKGIFRRLKSKENTQTGVMLMKNKQTNQEELHVTK
ncbi:hypothetical protein CHCC15325_3106 [Bacillus licheniformis]|nr:hypothetical protein CHCC15325_3106 [Bacillus licheniformis]